MSLFARLLFVVIGFTISMSGSFANAAIQKYRWENRTDVTDDLNQLLAKLSEESGLKLTPEKYTSVEDRDLHRMHFKTYAQVVNGVPVKGALIRTWSHPDTRQLIQMEATVDDGSLNVIRTRLLQRNGLPLQALRTHLSRLDNMPYVKQVVLKHRDDRRIGKIKAHDEWNNSQLQRVIVVEGKHGEHRIVVSHVTKKIISATYENYPQLDLPARVFEIYEETEKGARHEPKPVVLKNLLDQRRMMNGDPYQPLRNMRYFENKIDYVRGNTEEGRAQGYWSPTWLLATAKSLFEALPTTSNTFENGVFLEGAYATINLHPDVITQVQGLNFTPESSGRLSVLWKPSIIDGDEVWELIPTGAYRGRPITNAKGALERQARRLPDHNIVDYINDGFDEVQVYYAVDRLMQSLQAMGFNDPDLSTRPFHAFLYDPDISMKDNAYYTNDTINFTTYSPSAQNYARDNSTIWHELGHGVMDRLMGDMIQLADSGGLAEGMADFVAQLVIHDVTNSQPFEGSDQFRIINRVGFNLTNESHDDGEAYGGAMNDMLVKAIAIWGRDGLKKMTDLTLEAMRLARNHPGLTANDWFEQMIFADKLGRPGLREPNEMTAIIHEALQSRNFRMDRGPVAKFTVMNDTSELTDSSLGSRYNAIPVRLSEGEESTYSLSMQVTPSEFFQFRYPLRISVGLNGGPLEGAVKWKNEETGPFELTLNSANDIAKINLTALPGCDFVNREDNSCSDYAYIQIYNAGDVKPFAKKRFYVRVMTVKGGEE